MISSIRTKFLNDDCENDVFEKALNSSHNHSIRTTLRKF